MTPAPREPRPDMAKAPREPGVEMTTVLLVDDHPVVRSGLSALIASTDDLTVVGAATGGEQAITMATACEPDVVLMDLSMPGMDGIVATRRLLEVRPDTRVVVLTSFLDQDRVTEALAAGAVGYLLKDCDPRELLSAIRAASLGHAPLDPRVARVLLPASGERLGDGTDVDPSRPDQGRPDQGRPQPRRAGARRDAAPGLDSSGPGPSPDN